MIRRSPLERNLLAAFHQARNDGRLDVAEHVLKAIETLCGDCRPGSVTAETYLAIDEPMPRDPVRPH